LAYPCSRAVVQTASKLTQSKQRTAKQNNKSSNSNDETAAVNGNNKNKVLANR
jgi:hypothetical protein